MKAPMQIYTSRYPLGVCVAITPFNLPFLVLLWCALYSETLQTYTDTFEDNPFCHLSEKYNDFETI